MTRIVKCSKRAAEAVSEVLCIGDKRSFNRNYSSQQVHLEQRKAPLSCSDCVGDILPRYIMLSYGKRLIRHPQLWSKPMQRVSRQGYCKTSPPDSSTVRSNSG